MVEENRSEVVKGDGDIMDACGVYDCLPSCGICNGFPYRRTSVLDCGHRCSATVVLA